MDFLAVLTALIFLFVQSTVADAQRDCSLKVFKNVLTTYSFCENLQASAGAVFAWSFSNETYVLEATIYEQPEKAGGWTAWGINENNTPLMYPGNAIACYPDLSGTATVKQFHLSALTESGVRPGNKLNFTKTACTIDTSTDPPTNYIQFTLQLNSTLTAFNQIYGKGPGVDLTQPNILVRHNPTVNFGQHITVTTGLVSEKSSAIRNQLKITHGFLSAIGWGVLLPLGAIFSRYVRPFTTSLWFYIHISIQLSGYLLGVAGFGIGVMLWTFAPRGTDFTVHGTLGCAIFALGTAQILSPFFKPNKQSLTRGYWNVAHYLLGYATIMSSTVVIFRGFHLMSDYGNWKTVYIVIIAFLAGLVLALELVRWIMYPTRKAAKNAEMGKVAAGRGRDEEATETVNHP